MTNIAISADDEQGATRDPAAPRQGTLVDADFGYRVEQFYYYEAELLAEGRHTEWLDLFDADLHYWLPTRSNRTRRQQDLSVAQPGEAAFYDETKDSLAWRIRRFDSGMAWSEDPPSRTRHLITNVQVRHAGEAEVAEAAEFHATSAFLVYRSRLEREVDVYAGSRQDVLRLHADDSLKVAKRTILLESNVLLAKNISMFF